MVPLFCLYLRRWLHPCLGDGVTGTIIHHRHRIITFTIIMSEIAYKETRLRSVLKGLTWRIVATTTTAVIAYRVTGSIKPALAIGSVEFVSKFFIYYAHERLWQSLPRGFFREKILQPKSPDQHDPGI